jgi:hypothetical protein
MGIRGPDLEFELRVVSVFHFNDGRQIERWFYPESAALWHRMLDLE